MKQAYLFTTTLICLLTLLFSCSKEVDQTTTIVDVEDPESGETYSISGNVRDTTQSPIDNVKIRALFGDFEMEQESNESGEYQFKIPESEKAGYLIADKQEYYKEVLKVNTSDSEHNITMIRDSFSNDVSLKFDSTNYLSIRGVAVDQNGTPIYDAFCHVVGLGGNPYFQHLGVASSNVNGAFEVLIEKGNYQELEIHVFKDVFCTRRHVEFVEYTEQDVDIGNATIVFGQQNLNTSLIEVTDCTQNLLYSGINLDKIWYSTNGSIIDVSSNSMAMLGCDLRDELIYFGVRTSDNANFNGSFYNFSELPVNPSLDACTPSGNFLEIKLTNGDIYNFSEELSFQKLDPDVIGIANDDYVGVLIFSQHTNLPVNSEKIVEFGSGLHLELYHRSSGELVLQSTASNNAPYIFLDHDGTTNSGVAECNIIKEGNTIPAKIRFRLSE